MQKKERGKKWNKNIEYKMNNENCTVYTEWWLIVLTKNKCSKAYTYKSALAMKKLLTRQTLVDCFKSKFWSTVRATVKQLAACSKLIVCLAAIRSSWPNSFAVNNFSLTREQIQSAAVCKPRDINWVRSSAVLAKFEFSQKTFFGWHYFCNTTITMVSTLWRHKLGRSSINLWLLYCVIKVSQSV